MSINVKKGQRVTCKLSIPLDGVKGRNLFSQGREYMATDDNWLMDNFMAQQPVITADYFNEHFDVIPFTPVIQKKRYHLSYEFLGVKHEQVFDTPFEFGEAYCRIMDLAEVPPSTIDFKTEAKLDFDIILQRIEK